METDVFGFQSTDSESGARRRLGRGLNSLLGGEDQAPVPEKVGAAGDELIQVPVDAIERNPFQPRKDFDLESLHELSDSIAQHGVLQPLLVRPAPNGYQLIAGERRWLAARDAGLSTVPCRVMTIEDRMVSEVAIIENLQREDLNELEKAQAFQNYLDQFHCSIEELAGKLGKDRSTVSNTLRLLELPPFVKEAIRVGKISAGHGRALLPLDEEADQIAMCQRIVSEALSVRNTEGTVREHLEEKQQEGTIPMKRGGSAPVKPSNQILSLQDQIRNLVGLKVEIKLKSKDSGKLIIHFSSKDDFERVLTAMRKAS